MNYGFVIFFTALFAYAIIRKLIEGYVVSAIMLYFMIGTAFWLGLYLKRRAEVSNFRRLPQFSKFVLAWILIPHSVKVSEWVWENKPYWWKKQNVFR